MKCNHCEAELEEGVTVCPECGYDNAAAQEPAQAAVETPAADQQEPPAEEISAGQIPAEEGTESEKAPIVEGKLPPGKIALLVVLAVAAVAVVVALIVSSMGGGSNATEETAPATEATEATETVETTEATIPADGNPDDVTCKGTYTVSDDEMLAAKDTVVATAGDAQLTNGELQIYYWMQFYDFMNTYSSYAAYFGLDYTQGLDTQLSIDGTNTWQQYFLDSALSCWHSYAALEAEANKDGFEMDAEYAQFLDTLAETMDESAISSGFESAQAMLEADMGAGADMDSYVSYMREYYTGYLYYNELCDQVAVTDAQIEAYFDENTDAYAESGVEKNDETYVDVRHILVMPQGGTTAEDGTVTYSDEEWETCRASAQAILDEWLAGEATEENFAALANERSEDGGSNTNGGLYEDVYVGQMVEPFENWCFDASRQYGDTGLVQTDYGYHVMYFVESTPVWFATAETDLYNQKCEEILQQKMDQYELNVDYSAIVLGNVDFSAQ